MARQGGPEGARADGRIRSVGLHGFPTASPAPHTAMAADPCGPESSDVELERKLKPPDTGIAVRPRSRIRSSTHVGRARHPPVHIVAPGFACPISGGAMPSRDTAQIFSRSTLAIAVSAA